MGESRQLQSTVRVAFAAAIVLGVAASARSAQMEKRTAERYDAAAFAAAAPRTGTLAPEMTLRGLDGREVALSDYRGKTVVVIKAGYT